MNFYSSELPYSADASAYFSVLADLPWAVWLDSGGIARYDIITAAPQQTVLLKPKISCEEPFSLLRGYLGAPLAAVEDIPFAGGALGYWSYDLAKRCVLPACPQRDEATPDMAVGIYDWALLLDHQQQTAKLVSHRRYHETAALLPKLLERLRQVMSDRPKRVVQNAFRVSGRIASNLTPASYAEAFSQVRAYLQAGDCYQINLAQRFSATAHGDALEAYLELRRRSPAPYAAFLNLPQMQILCNSPERFLSVRAGQVETKPIKGTRPRSRDAVRDRRLADELCQHPKDRAENLMIVDLLRNDLGKNCEPGSVRVPQLFAVESYANVHHLVSTVRGELAAGRDALHLLQGCFPGGSVTGAPKQRAMQIIEQLEPDARSIYCGTVGYIGFDGNMDSNIAIRTLVYSHNTIRCWAGGGIVADSQCEAEYRETLDKASAMLALLQQFGGSMG